MQDDRYLPKKINQLQRDKREVHLYWCPGLESYLGKGKVFFTLQKTLSLDNVKVYGILTRAPGPRLGQEKQWPPCNFRPGCCFVHKCNPVSCLLLSISLELCLCLLLLFFYITMYLVFSHYILSHVENEYWIEIQFKFGINPLVISHSLHQSPHYPSVSNQTMALMLTSNWIKFQFKFRMDKLAISPPLFHQSPIT